MQMKPNDRLHQITEVYDRLFRGVHLPQGCQVKYQESQFNQDPPSIDLVEVSHEFNGKMILEPNDSDLRRGMTLELYDSVRNNRYMQIFIRQEYFPMIEAAIQVYRKLQEEQG